MTERTYQPNQFGKAFAIEAEYVEALKALGFADTSWGNNGCPSFEVMSQRLHNGQWVELRLVVWIDAFDKDEREYSTPRFQVDLRIDDSDVQESLYATRFDTAIGYVLSMLDDHFTYVPSTTKVVVEPDPVYPEDHRVGED